MNDRELITIGNETYIYDSHRGWVNKKTRKPADKNLITLLSTVSPSRADDATKEKLLDEINALKVSEREAQLERDKDKDAKIAPDVPKPETTQKDDLIPEKDKKPEESPKIEPIPTEGVDSIPPPLPIFGGSDFIRISGEDYAFTDKGWVDAKTQSPVNRKTKNLLESIIPDSIGAVGKIEQNKIRKKGNWKPDPDKDSGDSEYDGEPEPVYGTRLTNIAAQMISELMKIDTITSNNLDMMVSDAKRRGLISREDTIEGSGGGGARGSEGITELEDTSGGSLGLLAIGGIAALTALIVSQFKPVNDAFTMVVDAVSNVWDIVSNAAKDTTDFFKFWSDVKPTPPVNVNSHVPVSDDIWKHEIATAETTGTPYKPPANMSSEDARFVAPQQSKLIRPESQAEAYTSNAPLSPFLKKPTKPSRGAGPKGMSAGVGIDVVSGNSKPTQATKITTGATKKANDPKRKSLEDDLPVNDLNALKRWMSERGLRTNQNLVIPHGSGPHERNSSHYTSGALDINVGTGMTEAYDKKWGPIFDRLAERIHDAGYGVLWRVKGHYDHMHIDTRDRVKIAGKHRKRIKKGDGVSKGHSHASPVSHGSNESTMHQTDVFGVGDNPDSEMNDFEKIIRNFGRVFKAIAHTDTIYKELGKNTANHSAFIDKSAADYTKATIDARNPKPEAPKGPSPIGKIAPKTSMRLPSSKQDTSLVINQYIDYFD